MRTESESNEHERNYRIDFRNDLYRRYPLADGHPAVARGNHRSAVHVMPSDVSEIERLQAALRKIIDLDHHNYGPESRATKIARTVMPSVPEGRFASEVRIMIIDELNDLKRKNEQLFTDTRARIDELMGENERLRAVILNLMNEYPSRGDAMAQAAVALNSDSGNA
jgi:hypothetical protein